MERVLMAEDIMRILPHRYPFLLVDRATVYDDVKEALGIKNFTLSEPFFSGHFPERPIVPGVLLIESLAQLTAVLYCFDMYKNAQECKSDESISDQIGYMAKINNFKFKRIVIPGDQLFLYSKISEEFGKIIKAKVSAYIMEGEKKVSVVEGEITVTKR